MARILETMPAHTVGQVTLLADAGAACAYPIMAPAGVSIIWHAPQDGVDLGHLALAEHRKNPKHFLWMACEKSKVLRVRSAFKASNGDPAQAYISAYWSRG